MDAMGGFRRRVIAGVMEGLNADLKKTRNRFSGGWRGPPPSSHCQVEFRSEMSDS